MTRSTAPRSWGLGSSPAAIELHYDLPPDFFRLWLGDDLVYSCALWNLQDPEDTLPAAQRRKLDHFAERLGVRGARVLDVGCGWGALLERYVKEHGALGGVGLTLSPSQVDVAFRRDVPGTSYRLESWAAHVPEREYDVVTCIEATEHLATDAMTPDEKVEVYRTFFDRLAGWLRPGGRLGLQLICLDNAGHGTTRPGSGAVTDLILREIFPEAMSGSLSELALGWERHFELDEFAVQPEHYRRTFRAWSLALRDGRAQAEALIGPEKVRTFERYFAAGEVLFRLREQALYRAVLTRRPEPKSWHVPLVPSTVERAAKAPGASVRAVRSHYDVSNDFYRLWLGPSMMYSSALWAASEDPSDLETAHRRKIDFFAARMLPGAGSSVLDVGCGWGYNLRRLVDAHSVSSAVGLTLSAAQYDYIASRPIQDAHIREEAWEAHEPVRRYDAVFSYGAFEHFAPDGSTGPQRVASYREFFGRCFDWLVPGGRLGLETIAHDGAPDTSAPLGRGPLGDYVLQLFPESICPHLCELVLGLEPYFELDVLRSDSQDFARTFRAWLLRLRAREEEASALVGDETVRRFSRYLAASEVQFRTRALTNYRLLLTRRQRIRS